MMYKSWYVLTLNLIIVVHALLREMSVHLVSVEVSIVGLAVGVVQPHHLYNSCNSV
jgi:hypothetical protein